jgi:hypothetical protein
MVELELLQRSERSITLLDDREPLSRIGIELIEAIVVDGENRLPQERASDVDDARSGEHATEEQRERRPAHVLAVAAGS